MATQSTSAGGLDSTLGSDTEVSASSDPLRPSENQLRTERRRNIAAHFEGAAGASKHRTGTPHFWSVFAAKPTRAPVPSEADLRMGPHQKDREDPEVPTGRGAATLHLALFCSIRSETGSAFVPTFQHNFFFRVDASSFKTTLNTAV